MGNVFDKTTAEPALPPFVMPFSIDGDNTTGLNLAVFGGTAILTNTIVPAAIADTALVLNNNAANYISLDLTAGTIVNDGAAVVSPHVPIYVITTLAGAIISVIDLRVVYYPAFSTDVAVALASTVLAQDFRLSLTTGVPVTASDVAAATTIYAVPRIGNRIALHNGVRWTNYTSAEFSLALGILTAGKPYDIFCYQNAGVPTLEFLVWTNDTTRATALAYDSGILVKSGDATRRYLGSFYTISTTQTADSAAKRFLWNYYHRVKRSIKVIDTTASWPYSTATYRQANASTANQLDVLIGVAEDAISVSVDAPVSNSGATLRYAHAGIGINSTSVNSALSQTRVHCSNAFMVTAHADLTAPTIVGRNYYTRLELAEGTDVQTWNGSTGVPLMQSAIYGEVFS